MQQQIIDIINEIKTDDFLLIDDVDIDLIDEYKIDSIELIRILVAIEKAFGIRFDDLEEINTEVRTVRKIEHLAQKLMADC